jgi:uncharacterized protein (DUF983 family)
MSTAPLPPSKLTDAILRGLTCKCPRCGQGKLYKGFLDVAPACASCGLDYGFTDAGDGPAIFIILFAGFVVVFIALIIEVKYDPPFWFEALISVPMVLAATLFPLRSTKSLLISLQYHHKAREGRLAGREQQ